MVKIVKNSLGNFLAILLIFVLVTSWFYAGWPQIWQNPGIPPKIQEAQAVPVTLRPNATGTSQQWTVFGTTSAKWVATADQSDLTGVQVTGNKGYKETEKLEDPTSIPNTAVINSVTAWVRCISNGRGAPERLNIIWRDAVTTTEVLSSRFTVSTATSTNYSDSRTTNPDGGVWSTTTVRNLEIGTLVDTLGNTETIKCSEYWIVVTYNSHYMSAYGWFANTDTTDVGSPLAPQDTATTSPAQSTPFRLRLALHTDNGEFLINGHQHKLQYAARGADNLCDISYSGETYGDVTAATAIAFYNNTTPLDGDNLTDNANDPAHSGHTNYNQDYEEANPHTNSVSAIPEGSDGLWDFALVDYSAPAGTTYCFRIVASDGSFIAAPIVVPEITMSVAVPTVSCSSDPSTAFSTLSVSSIATSTPNVSATMSCNDTSSGCTLYIKDAGNGSNPGLATTSPAYLIPSPNAAFSATTTLNIGVEGYGIQATTTASLTIAGRYLQSGDTVGGLATSTSVGLIMASSTADIATAEVIVTHKAAISEVTVPGNYEDTITYSCLINT